MDDEPFDVDDFEWQLLNYPGADRLEDDRFWQRVSERALAMVWDNPDDDVYSELLK